MYYVMYVGAGRESAVRTLICSTVPEEFCEACFYPVRHLKKKLRGQWKEVYERLIPGYLFLVSEDIVGMYSCVRRIPKLMKILGKTQEENTTEEIDFYALTEEEVLWLKRLTGEAVSAKPGSENPVAELSQVGFDENDQVVVCSGPLESMKGQIKKINLHKRIAEVEIDFMGRKTSVYLGIEILGKDV